MTTATPFAQGRCLAFAVVVGSLFGSHSIAVAQPPAPTPLTEAQKERLKERDRYEREAGKHRAAGELPEAIAAGEKMLAIEREVLGDVHRDIADSLLFLAEVHQQREDFPAARRARQERLEVQTNLYGATNWLPTNARLDLAYVERLTELAPEQRKQLQEADSLLSRAQQHSQRGQYREAISLTEQALAKRQQIVGDKHWMCASTLNGLGFLYERTGDSQRAEALYQASLEIRKQVLGERHPDYAKMLNNLATLYENQGAHAKAEPLFQQAIAVYRDALGDQHPDYARALKNLGEVYLRRGDYARAEPLLREALAIRRRALGEKHPEYAAALVSLADWHNHRKQFAEAEPLYRQALEIYRQALGEKHPDYGLCLNNLASLYVGMGADDKAEPLLRQALDIVRQTGGEKSPRYAIALSSLAGALDRLADKYARDGDFTAARKARREALDLEVRRSGDRSWKTDDLRRSLDYLDKLQALSPDARRQLDDAGDELRQEKSLAREGRYQDGVPFAQNALRTYEQWLGEKHWKTAEAYHALGYLQKNVGAYAEALRLDTKAFTVRRELLGENHPDTAYSLHNLASVYETLGDLDRAEPLYRQVLATWKTLQGERSYGYANALQSLAYLLSQRGEYRQAETLLLESLQIRKELGGERQPEYAASLISLGFLYKDIGDYIKAEPFIRRALSIYKEALGERHPDYARSLDYLGTLYIGLGDYAKAEPLYRAALVIRKAALGEEHREYGITLHNLALVHQLRGEYAEAEQLLLQALKIKQQTDRSPESAVTLSNLARLYDRMRNYAKAEPLYQEALQIRSKAFGDGSLPAVESLYELAFHLARQGKTEEAERLAHEALHKGRGATDRLAAGLSQRQQLACQRRIQEQFALYLSVTSTDRAAWNEVYDEVLAWKAPMSAQQRALQRLRRTPAGKEGETGGLFAELEQTTGLLAARSRATPDPKNRAALRQELEDLSDKLERLQQQLADANSEYRHTLEQGRWRAADISKCLPPDTVLIDYVEYARFDMSLKPGTKLPLHLAAFIVHRAREVQRVELGPLEPIARAVDAWRAEHGRPGKSDSAAAELRRLVWQPVEEAVRDARVVLVSPGGTLARLPFAALPARDPGHYLIEEKAFATIAVPQLLPELLQPRGKEPADTSLLVVGAVDFDAGPAARASDPVGTSLRWPALPATAMEADAVAAAFRRRFPEGTVTDLRGPQPTQAAVRQEITQHLFLHFATHGYFAPPQLLSALAQASRAGGADEGDLFAQKDVAGFHPGLLSGLVLAGANRPSNSDRDNGVLTALEVEALDLHQAELVVLSACETGLGESAGGEGLLGLQRAFQTAGAHSTVAALWKVPDKATQALMARFYDNLWQKKLSRLEALREAQLWLLREGNRQPEVLRGLDFAAEQPADTAGRVPPFYWAAFTLSGDWR